MYLTDTVVSDENRDLNNHSDSQQVKRERSSEVHYNGGDASLYSNVSVSVFLSISIYLSAGLRTVELILGRGFDD